LKRQVQRYILVTIPTHQKIRMQKHKHEHSKKLNYLLKRRKIKVVTSRRAVDSGKLKTLFLNDETGANESTGNEC
jgi:hypothetical protein